jgi:hypothetical protein
VHHADERGRARRARRERDLDVAVQGGVRRVVTVAAQALLERLADGDLDAIAAEDDALGLDARAAEGRLSGAVKRAPERDPGGSSLWKSCAAELEAVPELDLTGRGLGDLDERRNPVTIAPAEELREEDQNDDDGRA